VSLHALRMVVIDEADRMLTSGHFKELQVIFLRRGT
jgi:superfamily II DNA/RNA helicase